MARKASFGSIRRLPSGRYQARYEHAGAAHNAPTTFTAKMDAAGWLAIKHGEIVKGEWLPSTPAKAADTRSLTEYAEAWVAGRVLRPRTRALYGQLIRHKIDPTLGQVRVKDLTADAVKRWRTALGEDQPTARAHAYSLLKSVCGEAVRDGLLASNPCQIRGASTSRRIHRIEPATLDELDALVEAMPPRLRLTVLLASWCALRFGEVTELRRTDIDLTRGVIKVRRAVTRVGGEFIPGQPKSAAGVRDVTWPPHLTEAIEAHLATHTGSGPEALLFPVHDAAGQERYLASSTLHSAFYKARKAAGRQDLRFHDLRHTGATQAAQNGATLAELMARLGHTTPAMAMRYQHAAEGRDAVIARGLSEFATAPRP